MTAKKSGKKPPSKGSRDSRARDERRPSAAEEAAETREVKKRAFLSAFAACGRITKAAQAVGMNPDTHYEWRKADPVYDKAFTDLRERVADILEDEAVTRALDGVEEPLIGRVGKDEDGIITKVFRKSDRLLEILLKANRPEKFRERYEFTGKDGGPIELSDADAAREIAALLEAARARETESTTTGEAEVGTSARPAN